VRLVDPNAEKLAVAIDEIKAYAKFWTDVFSAAEETEDIEVVASEALYRLFQWVTTDLMKYEHPNAYAWLRLARVVGYDVRTAFEETFVPESAAGMISKEYWETVGRSYVNFRLDQAPDFVVAEPDESLPEDLRVQLRQLSDRVFGLSDVTFGAVGLILLLVLWDERRPRLDQIYGWETHRRPKPPPGLPPPTTTGIPLPEHIASRAYTTRLRVAESATATTTATLTQLLLEEADGRLGWVFALRGAIAFQEKAGSKERPVNITIKVEATDGLDAVLHFTGDDRFVVTGPPSGKMSVAMAPAQAAAAAPAFAIPDATGTRLEIGDFTFKLELAKEGFKLAAATKKSAFVIAAGDADPFVKEALAKKKETRVEFDFGLTATQDGISIDGGGRLSTTISLNASVLGLTFQTLQLSLQPETKPGRSELRFEALGSFALNIGDVVNVVVDQIGAIVDLGSARKGAPDGAKELIPSLLYARDLGFRPPSGLGIRIDSGLVSGGGFLFFDREKEEYAGVLQLDFGRLSLTAIGLLTTRLPEGGEGYSFLIIFSLELDPPLQLGPLSLSAIGGLFGLRRALDTNALRAGLRSHTLDAILFPKDPITNAGRLLAALRTVFPPTRDKHVAGPMLRLGWGRPPIITAELALVFEWGASSRKALMGQLSAAFPPDLDPKKPGKKFLEINIDALGIWDSQNGDFSLDATLYDSHIAFIQLSGDAALRMKRGEVFLFSIGGYHPEFAAPPTFPKLEKLTMKLSDKPWFRLILSGYLAITSNTRQVGALIDFFAKAGSVSFEARISFDALWEAHVRFVIDFDVEMKIKYKSMTLFGVSVSGRFTGPEPKRVQGEWSVDLWLFSIGGPFDFVIGDDRPPPALPRTDPLTALTAALKDPRNWSAPLPPQSRQLVSFRNRLGSADVVVHPLGELGVRQSVLPLGIELDLFAGGVPAGERRFAVTKAFLGGDPVTDLHTVNDHFAAADFIELTDDEKLHRPSFDAMPAGVNLAPAALSFGGQAPGTAGHAADSEIDFEEVLIDADGNVVRKEKPSPLSTVLVFHAVAFGPAAQSQLRNTGTEKFAAESAGFAVGPERFAVAGVDNLAPASMNGVAPTELSHAAVAQALERHLREHPQDRGQLQVVPAFRTEVPT
jgi:Family of unknown function (DUF6603)